MLAPELVLWLHICCAQYKVEPAFALAVAQNESNFKCGTLGKKGTFAGPFGLRRRSYEAKYGHDPVQPHINILYGVRSLQGTETYNDKVKRLKKYNPEWRKNNYLPDVLAAYKQYKEAYK